MTYTIKDYTDARKLRDATLRKQVTHLEVEGKNHRCDLMNSILKRGDQPWSWVFGAVLIYLMLVLGSGEGLEGFRGQLPLGLLLVSLAAGLGSRLSRGLQEVCWLWTLENLERHLDRRKTRRVYQPRARSV